MHQFLLTRDGGISLRDQLATQIMLAIASGQFGPGDRLPSTRALANRCHLNINTVSAAYQKLEHLGWVHSLRGSGVYVGSPNYDPLKKRDLLDRLLSSFIQTAQVAGISARSIHHRVERWLNTRPSRFVFVHPEEELHAIIIQELRHRLTWPVIGCKLANAAQYANDSIFMTLPSKEVEVRKLLPTALDVVTLQIPRVDQLLGQYLPARQEKSLLVIASAWPHFLQTAYTILTAAGWNDNSMVCRDTKDAGWHRTIISGSTVVCDLVTAGLVPNHAHKLPFRLVSDATICRLKSVEAFFSA